jgi:putative oxidoreductase
MMTETAVTFLVARVLATGIWLPTAIHKMMDYENQIDGMRAHGIPVPSAVLPIVIVIHLFAAVMIIMNWQISYAALALSLFLIPANVVYHGRWRDGDGHFSFADFTAFWKNISILSSLLLLILLDPMRPDWLNLILK